MHRLGLAVQPNKYLVQQGVVLKVYLEALSQEPAQGGQLHSAAGAVHHENVPAPQFYPALCHRATLHRCQAPISDST